MSNPTRVWGQRNKTYLQLKGNKVKDQNFLRPWSCVNMLKVHELEGLNKWSLIERLVWIWNWVSDSQCWLMEPVAANCYPKRHQRFAKLLVMLPFPFYESLSLCLFLSFFLGVWFYCTSNWGGGNWNEKQNIGLLFGKIRFLGESIIGTVANSV